MPGSYAQSNVLWIQELVKINKNKEIKKNRGGGAVTLLPLLNDSNNNRRLTALSQINGAPSPVPNSKCHFTCVRPEEEYNYSLFMYQGTEMKFSKKNG